MSRTTRSLTCVLWLTLMGIAAAQSGVNDPGMATLQPYSGAVTFGGTNFNIYHLSGDGVGYRNGYTQIGATTPFWLNEDSVLAANGRLMITDTQQIGGNVGAFLRYLDPTMERIFGVNGYWDIDQSVYDNHYQQVGLGIETLGQWWDFRANGYFVTNDDKNFIGAFGIGNDLTYWQHRVGFLGVGQYENAISGGDWEFGVPLTPVTPWLRGYAGMYYYDAKANTPIGFRGRIEGWVADDLQLGVQVTQDRQFGTNVNAQVNFQFAGFRPTRWFPNFTTQDRMLIPVQRNWRVATGKFEQVDFVPAINPRTNQPYFIDWVDNSRILAGIGTYEHPFNYLPNDAPLADLILVRAGDTTALAPLSGSIDLRDWQRLLGEGREHQFQAYARYGHITTPVQTYNLPEFTNTGLYPFLTSNGNIVTLASHNEVSAFNLINANGLAITNTLAGSVNFNTNYLNLRDNNGGIILSDVTGGGQVSHVNALNNTLGGIAVDSGNAPLFLSFQDVTSSSIPAGNQLVGIAARADDGAITAEFNNVTTNGNSTFGILLTESNTGMRATLNNVNAHGNGVAGLRASGIGSELNLSLSNVDTSNNDGRGIWISGNGTNVVFNYNNLTDRANGGDNIRFTLINGSQLTGGGLHDVHFDDSVNGSGIVFDLESSRVGTVLNPFDIVNVTANRNGQDGMTVIASNGSRASFVVDNSSFNGNDVDGISVTEFGDSVVRMFVDPTFILDNGRDGFHFNVNDGSALNAVFAADIMAANGRSAFFGEVDLIGTGGSTVNLLINDTLARNSGADGMRITSANFALVNVTANHSSFSNSGQTTAGSSGIRFDANESTINLSLFNTPVQNVDAYPTGPQAFGLQLNLDNSDFNGTVEQALFSNNTQNGVLVNLANDSNANLTMTDVTADGNGADGLKAVVETASILNVSATTSSFSNNGLGLGVEGSGWNLSVDGVDSRINASLLNSHLDANARHGILGLATDNSVLSLTMRDNNTAENNGLDGLNVSAFDSQFIGDIDAASFSNNRSGIVYVGAGAGPVFSSITLSNVVADNNAVDGFRFNVSGGHQLLLTGVNNSFSTNGGTGILGNVSGAGTLVEINPMNYTLANFNGDGGLDLHVFNQGVLNANFNGGSFTGNGANGVFDGVRVAVDSAGRAIICFDGTASNSNTGDGYDFSAVDAGSRIDVALQTSGQFGTLQANSNAGQGVRFFVGPGASGTLFMEGDNEFIGNGQAPPVSYVVNGAALAAFSFSGTADGGAGDGINIQMTNVAEAYIDIHDGSASNNAESGIDISLNNVTFGATPLTVSFLQGDFSANPFRIENMQINGNGEEGIKIIGTDVIMPVGIIYNNSIQANGLSGAFDGIFIDLSGNSLLSDFSIGNDLVAGSANQINSNSQNGINFQLNDASQANLTIQGNDVLANTLNNIRVNLADNSVAALHIDNNDVSGQGSAGGIFPVIGTNFTGSTINDSGFIPPDTMGAVGPDNIVEMLNGVFAIYDRTGALISTVSLDDFYDSVIGITRQGTVFDPRIIYDPTTQRWFAAVIDGGAGNRIYIAVSDTSDPTGTWHGTQFVVDTIDGSRFGDFDTMGIDADGLYLATNNFGTNFDVSIFSIPKADLIDGTPSVIRMSRFEALDETIFGSSIQPAVDFGPSDGSAQLLAAFDSGTNLARTDLSGTGTGFAFISSVDNVTVPNYSAAPPGRQPSVITVENVSPRFNGNVVEVGDRLWAVHAVQGTGTNSAIRWYEIDANTNTVIQTGLIEDANRDFYDASIAVNASGDVVIGYSGSGPSQFISTMASVGVTSGGVTTFSAPTVLQAGGGNYNIDFGSGRNRWGDYSATVVDPNDPNKFWTFQEFAVAQDTWAVQITELSVASIPPVVGNTTGDGIQVNVLNNSTLLNSTINTNTANENGANGIHVTLRDNATMNVLNIDGNTTNRNGANGILFETPAGTPTINNFLTVNGPGDASNNGASGINVQLNNVQGTPSVFIDGTAAGRTVNDNGATGINFVANNTPINFLVIANNTVDPNQGDGISAVFTNSQSNTVSITDNDIALNVGHGVNLQFLNSTSVNTINLRRNQIDQNQGNGINLVSESTAIGDLFLTDSGIRGNVGHGFNLDLTNSPITNLSILDNNTGTNVGLGFFVDGSTFGLPFTITNTSSSLVNITDFTFDISTNLFFPGANFDTDSPPVVTVSAALPFAPSNGTEATTGLVTVNGSVAPNWAIPDESQIMTATFNDFQSGESFQWVVDLDQTPGGDEGYSGDQLIGSTVSVNFSNGANLTGTMQAVPGFPQASEFVSTSGLLGAGISSNQGDGIHIEQVNSNIANIIIDNNQINSNTGDGGPGHGINFAVVNNSNIGPVVISNNTIDSNTGDGIRLVDPNTTNNLLDFTLTDNTSISGNGANGVNFQISNGEQLTLRMTGNTISNNINSGTRAVISGASSLIATIGDSAANANTFDGNGDAGMSIVMSDNTTGSVTVANSSFNNSIDSTGATFNGVGLGIVLQNNASLSTLHIGDAAAQNTNFNGNASHGLELRMSGTSTIGGQTQILNVQANGNGGDGVHVTLTGSASIPDLLVSGTQSGSSLSGNTGNGFFLSTNSSSQVTTALLQDVTASENTLNGLQFVRQGASSVMNATIDNATLNDNGADGIAISAADNDVFDTYLISNSTITGNASDGVSLLNIGDADLDVTITASTITGNSGNGILATVNADVTDTPVLLLEVSDSTVSNNLLNGINIASSHFANIDGNTISGNTLDGINISGSSAFPVSDQIINNTISGNGDDGVDLNGTVLFVNVENNTISDNADDGVVMDSNSSGGQQIVTVQSNDILNNAGDGVQITARTASGTLANPNQYFVTNNLIADSGARGINVVNAGGTNGQGGTALQRTVTELTIRNNTITRSGLEAIYIINTASNTQANPDNVNNLATAALLADGSVFAMPLLNLVVDNNSIDSNGQTHNVGDFIGSSGVVVRVGTSDATTSFTNNGGFANGGRGGVVAAVTDNAFSGNFGSDVTFHPFVSTTPPDTTAGTWTDQNTVPRVPGDDVFSITSYVSDPLARLDLTFTGNTGNGLFATNPLAGSAFYNNDEPEFKSRGITGVSSDTTADGAPGFPAAPDDNGPFNTGTRGRNAARQALRGGAFTTPTIAAGSTFLYPGVGTSTFRVQGGAAFANSGGAGGNVFTTTFSNFSSSVPIGGDVGELPFVWGSF